MEIKKFEAYNYRGKDLDNIDRAHLIEEIRGQFEDGKFCGYDINGSMYEPDKEQFYIYLTKEPNVGRTIDSINKVLKLDFSDLGIEIGTQGWNDELEEMDEFVPERNLDTEQTKQIKNYKKDINKYNI